MGSADPLREKSAQSLQYYAPKSSTVLEHQEGHNIPSMATGLYPVISDWIKTMEVYR